MDLPPSSSLLHLPTEILERILMVLRGVAEKHLCTATNAHEKAIAIGLRSQVVKDQRPTDASWLALASTCRQLRSLTLGLSQLWTVIDAEMDARLSEVAAFRAGSLPLDLRLQFWRRYTEAKHEAARRKRVAESLFTVQNLLGRARAVNVCGLQQGHFENLMQALVAPMPDLQSLIIRGPTSSLPQFSLPQAFFNREHPLLDRVELLGFHQPLSSTPAFRSLRTLVLETVDFPVQNGRPPGAPRATAHDICTWLEGMPLLEKVGLHGITQLDTHASTPRVAALPHLAELALTAPAPVLLVLLSGLPTPSRVLALSSSLRVPIEEQADVGIKARQHTEASAVAQYAVAFYAADSAEIGEHCPTLDLKPRGPGRFLSLQLVGPHKTLALSLTDADEIDELFQLVCTQLLPLRPITRLGIVQWSALTCAKLFLPTHCTELVVDLSDSYFTGVREDIFPVNDNVVLSINVLCVIAVDGSVLDFYRLAGWLQSRASRSLPAIKTIVMLGRPPSDVVSALNLLRPLVGEVLFREGARERRLAAESQARLFLGPGLNA